MQLRPHELETLTWTDYHRLGQGFHRRQVAEWERTRWLAAQLVNVQLAPDDRLSLRELLPLPSDPPPPAAKTPEPAERVIARLRALDPDKFS